jgi:glutamate dehydrogenase
MDIHSAVERFGPGVISLVGQLDQVLSDLSMYQEIYEGAFDAHLALGIDTAVARQLAALPYLDSACEVMVVAEEVGVEVLSAARIYFALGAALRLHRLRRRLRTTAARHHWDHLALAGLYDDLFREQRRLAVQALTSPEIMPRLDDDDLDADAAAMHWLNAAVGGFPRWQRLFAELEAQPSVNLAMLSVAVRQLGALSGRAARSAA